MGARVPVLQLARTESIRELAVLEQKRGGTRLLGLPRSYLLVRVSVRIEAQQISGDLGFVGQSVSSHGEKGG